MLDAERCSTSRARGSALGRRAGMLAAAATLGGACISALPYSSAQAASIAPHADAYAPSFTDVQATFASLVKHPTVSWLCEPGYQTTAPTYSDNGTTNTETQYEQECSITAKLTVTKYAAHLLGLSSTTLASGPPKVTPVTTTTSEGQGAYRQDHSYIYSFSLRPGLIHALTTTRISGFPIDGFAMDLKGTASYVEPVNQENSTATQTATSSFSLSILDTTQHANQCWLPVPDFEVGLADPHGKRCPGW